MTKKRYSLLAVLLGVSIAALYLAVQRNPAQKQIAGTVVKGSNDSLEQIGGEAFSTYVPAKFRILRSDSPKGTLPNELYFLSKKDHRSPGQIGITAGKLAGMTIGELPSVRVRTVEAGYTQTTNKIFGSTALEITKTDGSEVTAYLQKGDNYAVMALSESTSAENITALRQIIDTWRWR